MLRKFVVVFAILVVVVAFFLMRDYDSPELGQALLDEVGAATGIEMTATGFRFNLFSGVELDNVTATSQSEGRSFSFSLDQLVFEHRILPLLFGYGCYRSDRARSPAIRARRSFELGWPRNRS